MVEYEKANQLGERCLPERTPKSADRGVLGRSPVWVSRCGQDLGDLAGHRPRLVQALDPECGGRRVNRPPGPKQPYHVGWSGVRAT